MSNHKAGIVVDLEAVRSFAADLRADLDGHLSIESNHILRTFVDTPSFGARTASPDVQAAATAYHHQLIKLLDLMETFVHNGAIMAQAANEVATAYAQADILSGDELQATFVAAADKLDAAIWAAQHDARTGRAA